MTGLDVRRLVAVALLGAISVSGKRQEAAETESLQIQKRHLTPSEEASTVEDVKAQLALFLRLPPSLRKQVLRYGRKWLEGVSR